MGILPDDPAILRQRCDAAPVVPAAAPDALAEVFAAAEKEIAAKAKAAEQAQVSDAVLLTVEARLQAYLPWINAQTARSKRSTKTRQLYAEDWKRFVAWCADIGVPAMPAAEETVGLYLLEHAKRGLSVNTIKRARRAIALAHELKFSPTKTVLVEAAVAYAVEQNPPPGGDKEN